MWRTARCSPARVPFPLYPCCNPTLVHPPVQPGVPFPRSYRCNNLQQSSAETKRGPVRQGEGGKPSLCTPTHLSSTIRVGRLHTPEHAMAVSAVGWGDPATKMLRNPAPRPYLTPVQTVLLLVLMPGGTGANIPSFPRRPFPIKTRGSPGSATTASLSRRLRLTFSILKDNLEMCI